MRPVCIGYNVMISTTTTTHTHTTFPVAFIAFDIMLFGYFYIHLYMGLFSIVFFFLVPFCLLDFVFILPGFYFVWGAQEF